MNRRGFLKGILAAGAAPWVCTAGGILMPVKVLAVPDSIFRYIRPLDGLEPIDYIRLDPYGDWRGDFLSRLKKHHDQLKERNGDTIPYSG